MPKPLLPVYDICTLTEPSQVPGDLIAERLAHYLDVHKDLHFPHKHSFYHLVYFSKGAGQHSIDFVNFPVQEGQVYFMIPGQVHEWNFRSKTDGYIINFSEQYISALIANPRYLDQFSFFSGIAPEQVIAIPPAGRGKVTQLLNEIVEESHATGEWKDDLIRTALLQLFIRVSRYSKKDRPAKGNNYNYLLLRNFQRLIEQYYKEKKLTKEYAALLYVTPNHLNALSKDVSGRSAGELIRDRVLLEAKRLLVLDRVTVSEIATELGFSDNSYFSKFFKKYEGLTPEAFRNKILKK